MKQSSTWGESVVKIGYQAKYYTMINLLRQLHSLLTNRGIFSRIEYGSRGDDWALKRHFKRNKL
ncbi:MAG: hypothetical protein C4532_16585 [Candidatus Abyssobacteria bacterium SURF_17]|uniref:Uncharacterized protein n=1 Tax=Candidatus Abyssobacteria bacterium SURF_17 TaxID=2093361 RepID=A0A419ERU4_9BACT|nr:MAG: hypothetical protein C4532_16585 [Candidatus Abyssubacteria bacterium SURF_17]